MLQWNLNITKGQGTEKLIIRRFSLYQGTFPYITRVKKVIGTTKDFII